MTGSTVVLDVQRGGSAGECPPLERRCPQSSVHFLPVHSPQPAGIWDGRQTRYRCGLSDKSSTDVGRVTNQTPINKGCDKSGTDVG